MSAVLVVEPGCPTEDPSVRRGPRPPLPVPACGSLTCTGQAGASATGCSSPDEPTPIRDASRKSRACGSRPIATGSGPGGRSEEHTSELQSLMRNSYAVFCLKQKNDKNKNQQQLL